MARFLPLLTLLILMLTLPVMAADAEADAEVVAPKDMDGITLYKTYCKACHATDSEFGEYAPMDLIMDQWDEVFDAMDESHAEAKLETTDGQSVPAFLGGKLLDRIRKFCVDHAADSEEPMTCG